MITENKIGYYEWLAEVNTMDRNLDSKEKMKVWTKFAWHKPLNLPPIRKNTQRYHYGGRKNGEPLNIIVV